MRLEERWAKENQIEFHSAVMSILFGFHSHLLTAMEIYCERVKMNRRTAMTMFYVLSNSKPCWRKK